MPAGIAFGLIAGSAIARAGQGALASAAMSLGVYGAAAQLAATLLWMEGTPLVVVVATALVINARFIIYSASAARVLARRGVASDIGLAYLIRDGAYALTMARAKDDPDKDTTAYFLGAALLDWGTWVTATVIGTLGAASVPETWSLDFIVPLVFLGLVAGALSGRTDAEVALLAALAAAVLVPLLPLQTGILAAIVLGMVWGYVRHTDEPPAEAEGVLEP